VTRRKKQMHDYLDIDPLEDLDAIHEKDLQLAGYDYINPPDADLEQQYDDRPIKPVCDLTEKTCSNPHDCERCTVYQEHVARLENPEGRHWSDYCLEEK
jgi:hypothetical protein